MKLFDKKAAQFKLAELNMILSLLFKLAQQIPTSVVAYTQNRLKEIESIVSGKHYSSSSYLSLSLCFSCISLSHCSFAFIFLFSGPSPLSCLHSPVSSPLSSLPVCVCCHVLSHVFRLFLFSSIVLWSITAAILPLPVRSPTFAFSVFLCLCLSVLRMTMYQ